MSPIHVHISIDNETVDIDAKPEDTIETIKDYLQVYLFSFSYYFIPINPK